MKKYSELTFYELTKNLGFVKVWWNGEVVFDDTVDDWYFSDLKAFYRAFGNRYVYEMKLKIVAGHHCELKVKGEKEFQNRKLVIAHLIPNLYDHDQVAVADYRKDEKVTDEKLKAQIIEEAKNYEYLAYKEDKYKVYKVSVRNLDKYPWIKSCDEFYIVE